VASRVNGNLDGFRLLVASGADLHAVTNNGITTLGAAIVSEPEKVALLISNGVEINDKFNYAGWTALYPLQLAVTAGNTEVVRLLVNKGADINRHASVDFGALPPLSRAVSNGQAAMVKLLLSLGADANYVDPLGMTPLLWAASSDYGHGEIVKALLAAGANPNARDKDGSASSALAKKYKIDGVIPLLTKKPARAPL
jgi:ankyrin repeat protein